MAEAAAAAMATGIRLRAMAAVTEVAGADIGAVEAATGQAADLKEVGAEEARSKAGAVPEAVRNHRPGQEVEAPERQEQEEQ